MRPRCGQARARQPSSSSSGQWTTTLHTQSAAGQQLVPGHRCLHSAHSSQYIGEEWRSENCVMVTCMKKICSLKVFSIEPLLILSLCKKIDTSHDNSWRNYDTWCLMTWSKENVLWVTFMLLKCDGRDGESWEKREWLCSGKEAPQHVPAPLHPHPHFTLNTRQSCSRHVNTLLSWSAHILRVEGGNWLIFLMNINYMISNF